MTVEFDYLSGADRMLRRRIQGQLLVAEAARLAARRRPRHLVGLVLRVIVAAGLWGGIIGYLLVAEGVF